MFWPQPFIRATLEEIQDAALLLHVVDISHPHAQAQAEAVDKVLAELNIGDIPLITAWNKVDRCPDPEQVSRDGCGRCGMGVGGCSHVG